MQVLFHGGAMSLGPLKDATPAIVSAGYGGEAASDALADVLFGDYNPSGKLAATWYPPSFVSQVGANQHLFFNISFQYLFCTFEFLQARFVQFYHMVEDSFLIFQTLFLETLQMM